MYPQADVPVVPMSVDVAGTAEDHYRLGAVLRSLRDEGVMILASGNVVHNLALTNWDMEDGYDWADDFDRYVNDAINASDFDKAVNYHDHPASRKAVPTVDHY